MMKYILKTIVFVGIASSSFIYAEETKPQKICVRFADGKCKEMVLEKSCVAPLNGECTATVAEGNKTATCTAKKGAKCTARIRL
jgi:hypothetical protein